MSLDYSSKMNNTLSVKAGALVKPRWSAKNWHIIVNLFIGFWCDPIGLMPDTDIAIAALREGIFAERAWIKLSKEMSKMLKLMKC